MGSLPRYPFEGTPPSSSPAGRPPVSSLMVGQGGTAQCGSSAWRFSVRDIVLPCALVGPLFPPPPSPCLLYASFLGVRLLCCFFFMSPCSRSPLLPGAMRVPPAPLRATPVSPPRAPSLACLPSHSPSCSRPCLYVCPPRVSRAVTRVCHPRALRLPLSVVPTLFPGVSSVPSVPVSHLILDALCPVWVGGVYLRTGLWPCLRTGMAVGFLRPMSHRIF